MEASFENIVLYTALTVLILLLVIVGVMLHYSRQKYKPMAGQCPDNFEVVPSTSTKTASNGTSVYDGTYTCKVPTALQPQFTNYKTQMNNFNGMTGNLNLDTTNFNTINFSDPMWSGKSGLCYKYQWATGNPYSVATNKPIDWDGVTNVRPQCT